MVDQVHPAPPDLTWRLYFATATGEIAGNIVRHAHAMGAVPGTMHLYLRLYDDRIEARFADCGLAFDGTAQPARPESGPSEMAESGRGLALARAALDELAYHRTPAGTNHWRLVKRFASGGDA